MKFFRMLVLVISIGVSFLGVAPNAIGLRKPTPPQYSIALYPRTEIKEKINKDFKHIPESRRFPVALINIRNRVDPVTGRKIRSNAELALSGFLFGIKDLLRANLITSNQLDIVCGKPMKNEGFLTYQLIGIDGFKKERGTYFIDARFVNSKLDSFRVRGDGIVKSCWQTTKFEKDKPCGAI